MAYDSIIPDAFPAMYEDEWRVALQQLRSRLESFVNVEIMNGEGKRFQKIAAVESREITTRFGDTNPEEVDLEFRWLHVDFKDSAHIVDRREAIQLGEIGSPHSQILRLQLAAAGRDRDATFINGILGNAASGKRGETPIPLPADQTIPVNFVAEGTPVNSNIGLDKILEGLRRFGVSEVMGQDVERQDSATLIITHNQIPALLREEKFTSTDYSEIRRLHTGTVISLMGVSIVAINPSLLPYDADNDIRTCVMFARDAVVFGVAENPQSWVDVLPGKKHDVQLRTEWGWGALRLYDEGVLRILCDESPPAA